MNERIRELFRQSHLDVYGLGKDRVVWEATVSEFAELIVEECAEVCLNPNHWYEDAAGETFNRVIKQHFGVEE